MEERCLVALNNFNGSKNTHQEVVEAINLYGPLLERRGEDNHFFEKHNAVLNDRPWEKCRCPVCRDLAMIKVATRESTRGAIMQLVNVFRARVVDVSPESLIVEITGTEDKIDGLVEMLRPYGVLEMARTGRVAMVRGAGSRVTNGEVREIEAGGETVAYSV